MGDNDNDDRGAFIWYELMTPDPAAAKQFYEAVMGWEIIDAANCMPGSKQNADMDYRMIRRADGGYAGGVMAMDKKMQESGARPGWLGYIHHPDVDAAAKAIAQAGGSVHMGPVDMEGVGRMAMVADPQGAMVYVMNPIPPEGEPNAQSDVFDYEKPQHVRWNELQSTDQDAALALYGQLFGWKQDGAMPMGEMGEYKFIARNGGVIGAVMPKMPDLPRSVWSFYVGVDDIDRAAAAVTAKGGRLDGEIMQIPGGDYAVTAVDPQGAAIGLVGPRKGA